MNNSLFKRRSIWLRYRSLARQQKCRMSMSIKCGNAAKPAKTGTAIVKGENTMKLSAKHIAWGAVTALFAAGAAMPASAAWEPTRPVEFIIPAGTGGGADQMARTIQGIVTKHNLMKQPMVVINKAGGCRRRRLPRRQVLGAAIRTRSSSRCRTCSPRRWRPAFRSTGRTSRRSRCWRSTNSCCG